MENHAKGQHPISPYEFFMLCLCVWALLSMASLSFLKLTPPVVAILTYADYAVCAVFFLIFSEA